MVSVLRRIPKTQEIIKLGEAVPRLEMYEHIHFVIIEEKPKTKVWSCRNNNSGEELGQIKWHGAWRQYCYFPSGPAVYSVSCLENINDFIRHISKK